MNPLQRKKIDISSLSPQEQQLFAKYGKLPTHKNVLMKMQKDRKFFDSGDYALSKAGKAPQSTVGTAIPNPENIPHATPSANGHHHNNCAHPTLSISPTSSISPILQKESSLATDENTTPPVDTRDEDATMSSDVTEDVVEPTTNVSVEATTIETTTPVASIAETVTVTETVVNKSPSE